MPEVVEIKSEVTEVVELVKQWEGESMPLLGHLLFAVDDHDKGIKNEDKRK